jgi:hypothetical protein
MASNDSHPPPPPPNTLRSITRLITTHSPDGTAIFHTVDSGGPRKSVFHNLAHYNLIHTSTIFPADFADDADVALVNTLNPQSLVMPGGSICRFVDIAPMTDSPMHRTQSLDYGIVIEGEVEIVLDGGEKKIMKRGDVCVQRGTNHAWNNRTEHWARLCFILLEAKPVVVDGKELGEALGDLKGDHAPSHGKM